MHHAHSLRFVLLSFVLSLLPAAGAGVLEDRAIEDAIRRSYIYREILSGGAMVQLYVRHGLVELRGQVADEQERTLIDHMLAGIPGITRQQNRLFVDSEHIRASDRWLVARLRAHLLARTGVDAAGTQISIEDGVVVLTGRVASLEQRALTEQQVRQFARVVSVRNELMVDPTSPVLARVAMDDVSVSALVRSALDRVAADWEQEAVVSRDGHVTLRGTVASADDIARFTDLASTVRGVLGVTNVMTVRQLR